MRELGVKPEMEVYDLAMFRDVNAVIEKGLVEKPYYINLVLGMRYQGACDATPKILMLLHDYLPPDAIFNCTAVGTAQLPLTTLAMILGGCVRVGLEDNIYYSKGKLATNAQLVARTVRIARELGKEPAGWWFISAHAWTRHLTGSSFPLSMPPHRLYFFCKRPIISLRTRGLLQLPPWDRKGGSICQPMNFSAGSAANLFP